MADPAVEQVLSLMTSDTHLKALTQVLCGLQEKQRRALSGRVRDHADRVWLGQQPQNAAALAVLGCVTGVRQVAAKVEWLHLDPHAEPMAVQILRHRDPPWLPELPAALVVGKERVPRSARLVRALVREGLLPRPEFPEYSLALARGLDTARGFRDEDLVWSVLDALRADPGLIEHELWEILRTEGAGKELASSDAWQVTPHRHNVTYGDGVVVPSRPERTWQHALVTLAAEGIVERARLLDETLAACLRDWTAADVGWFVALHDALSPTLDELVARQQTYARLLAVTPGVPVGLALRTFTALLKAGRLDHDVLLAAAPAALARSDKGPALKMLKILGDLVNAQPAVAERAANVVVVALAHERADVQERALAALTAIVPDAGQRQALIAPAAHVLAPSLRAGARAAGPDHDLPPPPPDPERERLPPVEDADELAELFARLVEEADDPAEVERLLDGVCRLARQRPRRGADALVRRLDELTDAYWPGAWSGEDLRADLVAVGLTWLAGVVAGEGYQGRLCATEYWNSAGGFSSGPLIRPDWSMSGLVTLRIHEVARCVAAGGATLLAFPEYRDGTLGADELSRRLAALGRLSRPLPLDAGLALLRVPPDQLGELRLPAAHRTSSRAMSEQLALWVHHRPAWERVVGESTGLYHSDRYERAVTWRDRDAPVGSTDRPVQAVLDRRDPLPGLALEAQDGEYASRFEQVTATWPLLLPHHPDLLAAHAHPRLVRALTKNRSGTEPLLDAVGGSRQPIGPPACSALVLGMGARNAGERAHAVDALVELSARDRLPGADLGRQLAALLSAGGVTGPRVVGALADAARVDRLTASVVLDALVAALPALPGRRDAHLFVDLLAQLAVDTGRRIELPAPLVAAVEAKGSSVLQRACRRVPR